MIVFAIAVLASAVTDITRKRPWNAVNRGVAVAFVGALDVQLTLGLVLIATSSARGAMTAHASAMIAAVAAAHVGNVRLKRTTLAEAPKTAALFFGLALIIIVAAIPWSRPLLRY